MAVDKLLMFSSEQFSFRMTEFYVLAVMKINNLCHLTVFIKLEKRNTTLTVLAEGVRKGKKKEKEN